MMRGISPIDLSDENDLLFYMKVKPPMLSKRQTIINKKTIKN